jgi:hypothetical protein
VVFVGDGEFDGCELLAQLETYGWHYVCRTGIGSIVWIGHDKYRFGKVAVEYGGMVALEETAFTRKEYGPVLAIALWEKPHREPLYLISNLELAGEAIWYYRRRFRIETLFSDYKSRGFKLDKSHLREPERLGRLLLAAHRLPPANLSGYGGLSRRLEYCLSSYRENRP